MLPVLPRNIFLGWLVLAALAGIRGRAESNDGDWNQFRGPNGSGVARGSRPPVTWTDDSIAWKTQVPAGLSAPVIARDRIFLTAYEDDHLVTLAFDSASGRRRWRQADSGRPHEEIHQANSPATPTPCADDERVYVYFGSFGLLCYDLDGRPLWRRPIPTAKSLYGTATSPILHGDNLILVLDDDGNLPDSKLSRSRVIAVNKASGELVWETARPLIRSGWSTPTIWKHGTEEDLVVLGSGRLSGYDPATGAEKWFVTGFSRETIAQPVSGNGHLYASSAMLGGVADAQPDPEPFWKSMLHFDADGDGRIARDEMTENFTFPFRPELPVGHPGFGLPLPADPARRKDRQTGIFDGTDKNHDGYWTRDEFVANLSFRREKPKLTAIRPGGNGDVSDTHVAWQLNRSIPEIPTPLFYEGRLYLVRNGGILTAVDAGSGTILYDERLGSAGQYGASPVAANGHLYLVSNAGVVTVVKSGGTFQKVHQHALGEAVMVTPAIDATTLYIRTASNLQAFRRSETDGLK